MWFDPIDTTPEHDPLVALMINRGEEPDDLHYTLADGCSHTANEERERYVAQDTLGACEMDLKYARINRD